MPKASPVGGFDIVGLVPLMLVLAAVLGPLLFVRRGAPPDASDEDRGGGGGGPGPPSPPRPTAPPGGGLPLPDAVPARVRLRGHERLTDLLPPRARRRAREPGRIPTRASTSAASASRSSRRG